MGICNVSSFSFSPFYFDPLHEMRALTYKIAQMHIGEKVLHINQSSQFNSDSMRLFDGKHFKTIIFDKDGADRVFEVLRSIKPRNLEADNRTYACIDLDITECVRTAEKLKAFQKCFLDIFHFSPETDASEEGRTIFHCTYALPQVKVPRQAFHNLSKDVLGLIGLNLGLTDALHLMQTSKIVCKQLQDVFHVFQRVCLLISGKEILGKMNWSFLHQLKNVETFQVGKDSEILQLRDDDIREIMAKLPNPHKLRVLHIYANITEECFQCIPEGIQDLKLVTPLCFDFAAVKQIIKRLCPKRYMFDCKERHIRGVKEAPQLTACTISKSNLSGALCRELLKDN
jgi:hypothetical protein